MEYYVGELSRPYLRTLSLMPENQETPIHFLKTWITPEKYFYRRNHFSYPMLSPHAFFLPITGEVKQTLIFPYCYLKSLSSKSVTMVLECSGNKRSRFSPRVYGEQWEDGAISQGVWKGVALRDLLNMSGLNSAAVEVVFEGYDYGKRTDMEGIFHYARSLPMEKAMHQDTIIAYELNGKSIPYAQGGPFRLIIPQWYAMASVKWLKQITVIDHNFDGPFQTVDYIYYPHKEDDIGKKPVTNIKTDSIIQQPLSYTTLDTGVHNINGIAWTGYGTITDVELSFDEGTTWKRAKLRKDTNQQYAWTFWEYQWNVEEEGEYTIMCRAKDSTGGVQPLEAEWNRKGYGYNAVYTIKVKVE
ncbi:DMSO/TMAO reductase YedYZ molybdopterin-dependent catalytic subunit [Anaerosolibacter carboniphilus]|uniref:DMSO/TMAO reductase YedYZ molybdopterin-dependent catalytic subunit n=1 Tax=Anaerosolibacter carboniphilus TaxID=1417629 RepID=A0A841KLB7_9FIRM|nr:sulfite oxidase [Anaerosolibacter carboniphilus]MBB6214166.1 DMSO/TMAO reductase YedYZ molybdopterin-dependent catalytic subunit [Anaerosolibacter carboniphilus]